MVAKTVQRIMRRGRLQSITLVEAIHAGVALAGGTSAQEVHLARPGQGGQLLCIQLPGGLLGLHPYHQNE